MEQKELRRKVNIGVEAPMVISRAVLISVHFLEATEHTSEGFELKFVGEILKTFLSNFVERTFIIGVLFIELQSQVIVLPQKTSLKALH